MKLIRPVTRTEFIFRIHQIDQRVKVAEMALLAQKQATQVIAADRLMHETSPVNRATYLCSSLDRLGDFLLTVDFRTINPDFKQKRAGVPGGGLLGAASVLAYFFEEITSWELESSVWKESLNVVADLGLALNRIIPNLCNMFEDADVKGFDLLYFFQPILDNYGELGKLLKKADPGTIILSPIFVDTGCYPLVFPHSHFIRHQPLQSLLYMFDIHERNREQ